jgi:hypothetical protein
VLEGQNSAFCKITISSIFKEQLRSRSNIDYRHFGKFLSIVSYFRQTKMAKRKKPKRQKPPIAFPDNQKTTNMIARPRVSVLCKTYNVSDETLLEFLESKGYYYLNLNSLLDENAVALIQSQFQRDKVVRDKVRGNTTVKFTNSKIPEAVKASDSAKNDRSKSKQNEVQTFREPVLHLTTNLFRNQKSLISYKKMEPIKSNFKDDEAINICSKMSSSFTRNLCKQLNNSKVNRQLILYQIHHIANSALKVFGGKILTFIHGLRNLNFKNKTADEIKTYSKVVPDFPIISFDTGSSSFKISFFVKQVSKNKLQPDIRLFASKTFEEVGAIDEEGYVLTRLNKFKPQLTLFFQAAKNNNFKIYSGVESGNCDICGRELSHPLSLRVGVGPVCARNNNVDTVLYNFA